MLNIEFSGAYFDQSTPHCFFLEANTVRSRRLVVLKNIMYCGIWLFGHTKNINIVCKNFLRRGMCHTCTRPLIGYVVVQLSTSTRNSIKSGAL